MSVVNSSAVCCFALIVASMPAAGQAARPAKLIAGIAAPISIHSAMLLPAAVGATSAAVADASASIAAGVPLHAAPAAAIPPRLAMPATPAEIHAESLFDAVAGHLTPVLSTVEVKGVEESIETISPHLMHAGGQDVLTTAGTFGDISRYLQIFPGVVSTGDVSNQLLVRGGHPMENLFLVDGIEVPNINHLANANTTGGLGPMIDAAVIQDLDFQSGGFEAKYPERLSSVTEFHSLDDVYAHHHVELDLGIQGVGGLAEKRVGAGDLLASAHHGLINLVSQDVGINGVPSYDNELTRYRRRYASGSSFTMLNLAGLDSISITPCPADAWETSTINSRYTGWRETTGFDAQHVHTTHAFSSFNVSDSEQIEHINEADQVPNPLKTGPMHRACPVPDSLVQTIPVYSENSNNAFTTAKYNYQYARTGMAISAGSAFWLQRPHFDVNQPSGAFSPYDPTMTRTDASSFHSDLAVGESGTYAQSLFHPTKALSISAGGRLQTFAFGNHVTATPRLTAAYQLGESTAIHATYASYAQMPPYAYMLAYAENRNLAPMRASHEIVGMDFGFVPRSQVRAEAYLKQYTDIPVSTEYSGVTLHTMVDMLGAQTVWLPMMTGGRGNASGIELSDRTHIGTRFQALGSVAYARARFAGRDGVMHPSNFDLPWVINAAGVEKLGRGYVVSARYGYMTGRPYTPFNMALSTAQNRPIYDLTQINVPRSPSYSRLDAQLNKEMRVRAALLEVYLGVDNLLNHENFLSYAWMPRAQGKSSGQVGTLWQTPIFPNFGVRLILR